MADSNITKRALAGALKELMENEPFSKISVADICEKCDMNRKSFYYHFKDKYDLVNWIFDTEFIAVVRGQGDVDDLDWLEALVKYFYEHRNFYRKALSVTGQNSFSDHFRELLFSVISIRLQEMIGVKMENDFQANFFTDAIILALQRWIMNKDCMPPEEFMQQLRLCFRYVAVRYNQELV